MSVREYLSACESASKYVSTCVSASACVSDREWLGAFVGVGEHIHILV